MGFNKAPRRRCFHCGLPGHNVTGCHVKAEGRDEIDAADGVAAVLVLRATPPGSHSGGIPALEMRRVLAAYLRRLGTLPRLEPEPEAP